MRHDRRTAGLGLASLAAGLLAVLSERASFAEPSSTDVPRPQTTSSTDQTIPASSPSAADLPQNAPSDSLLRFRRVYVPERQIGVGSDANQRFLPMKADEFERLLRQFQSPAGPEALPSPAELKSARYSATLSGDALIAGQATLEIGSLVKRSVLLSLDPCRLAIDKPRWVAASTTSAENASEGDRMAVALGARVDGKLALRVSESGTLTFGWTLRGQREAGGDLIFPLRLPRCPSTTLQLTLPAELAPVIDQAIVTTVSDDSPSHKEGSNKSPNRDNPRTRLWHVELGGQNLATLRIVAADTVRESRPLTLIREATTYEFSPRGLQVSADLKLDVLHEAIRQIPLDIDSPLTLVTARIGDVQVPWYEVGTSDGPATSVSEKVIAIEKNVILPVAAGTGSRRIVLQLPEPLRSTGRVVRLGAIAPLETSGRLPTIRPAPPAFLWQEGTTTLLIQSPLQLNELRLNGCRQTKRESLPPDARTEAVTLQNFRPDADVNVAVGRRRDQFTADCGTLIDAGGASIRGTATIDITSQAGECFSMIANVPASWIIDSVDSSPAGGVSNWSLTRSTSAPSRLKMSFTKAVRTDRPLRVVVNGRWRRAPKGETLRVDDLQMLDLEDVHVGRCLAAIRVAAPLNLQISDDEKLSRLSRDRLDAADISRLGDATGAAAILAIQEGANAAVTFNRDAPNYNADVRLNLGVSDDALSESYTITCAPKSSDVDRLLVQFFPASSTAPEWAFLPDETPTEPTSLEPIAARRLSQAAQAKIGISVGEVWELTWQHPRAKTFRIAATRTSPLAPSLSVALAQLPGASSQSGRVEVRSTAMHRREIRNRRLQQVDCPPTPPNQWPDVIAAYEYNPAEQAALAAADPLPALTIGPAGILPDAWVWSMEVDTHWLRQGLCENTAIWRIENTGRSRISIKIPSSAAIGAIWIDDTPAQIPGMHPVGTLELELPAGRRFPVVALRWSCLEPPLVILGSRALMVPEVADIPVLARKGRLWLPPNWQLIGGPIGNSLAQTISWSQRLFGPFGQAVGDTPFDPFAANDWRGLAAPLGTEDAAWSEATRMVSQINSAARDTTVPSSKSLKTWSELLRAVAPAAGHDEGNAPAILIDRQALADAGICPETSVGIVTDIRGPSGALFDDADLTILVAPEALLITTRSAASNWLKTTPGNIDHSQILIPAGGFREQLRAATAGTNPAFVPKDLWCSPDLAGPWTGDKEPADDLDRAGWMAYNLESLDGPVRLWLVRRDVIVAAGCALFLVGFVVAWKKHDAGGRTKCITIATVAAAALLIPAWLAPLGSGLFLGFLGGWLFRWMTIVVSRHETTPPSLSRRMAVLVGIVASFIAVWIVGARSARSVETQPHHSAASDRPIYDVLVPVDDHDHPVGNDVFLPQPLYDEILARGARHAKTDETILTAATYRGSLVQDAAGKPTVKDDWSAHFELVTAAAGTILQLPFGGEDVHLVPDGVRLDGRTTEFESKASGRGLALAVPQAGRHELDLQFRPGLRATNSTAAIELTIPRVPNAHLELDTPNDVAIETPSAEGLASRDKQGHLVAALGAADRLVIRTGSPETVESQPLISSVEELLWLKVRPGSVILDTRLIVHVEKGRLRQVQLVADPRLRRLPLEGGSPIAQVQSQMGELNRISLGLAQSITEDVAMNLSFLVTETSGIGNLRIPRLDVVGARSVNRRLAVSIEPPLAADDRSLDRLKTASVADFLGAWGPSDAKPQFAFLAERADTWSLAVHPRDPQLTAKNSAIVSYGAERMSAAWLTDLTIDGGSIYQLQLSLPENFTIDSAALRENDEADSPLRWSKGAAGEVTVFLPSGPTDHYQLIIRGSAPTSHEKSELIPDLRIAACALQSKTIVILRQSDATTTVIDRGGLSMLSGKEIQQTLERAAATGLSDRAEMLDNERLVAVLAGGPTAGSPLVHTAKNMPRVEGSQRTTVERNGSEWTTTIDLDVTISGGILDTLRLELPPQLRAMPEVSPPIASKLIEIPGEANRWLVLRPAEPLVGTQHLRLRAPIATGAGERLRVPDVRLLGVGPLRRIVLLPTVSNDRHFFWETRGLRYESLPASFSAALPHTEVQRTCEVVADHFEATLNSVEKSVHRPRVRLADVRLAMSDESTGYGIASFDLDAAGSESCLLELPADERLLQARVNDGPASVTPTAPNRWAVAGGRARLPQHIEILFAVDNPSSGVDRRSEIRAPALVGFAVDRTLWSITSQGQVEAFNSAAELQVISPLDAALMRLEACSAMLESAGDQLSNEAEDQAAQVYSAWAQRLSIQRAAIDRERKRVGTSSSDTAIDAAIRTVDGAQARLAHALGAKTNVGMTDRAAPASESALIWTRVMDQDRPASIFLSAGPSAFLSIQSASSLGDSLGIRFLIAIACSGLILGAFWLARRHDVQSAIVRWPWGPAAVGGVAWWLWLSPSFVGLVIVAVSIFYAYRGRNGRSASQAISTARAGNQVSSIVTLLTPTRHFPTQTD